ncbi:MAG: ABA4-like family protein [Pelagibacteraceae bacterium]
MLETIKDFFTLEMIYHFANIGVIPLWLLIILAPRSKVTQGLINNLFIPFVMAMTYGYLAIEQIYPSDASIEMQHNPLDVLKNFQLYLGLDQLMSLFDNTLFVLIFWIHFLTISLFLGAWIANDAIKHNLNKFIVLFPLILTYFSGPIGLFLYLFLRLLIVQKFKMYD